MGILGRLFRREPSSKKIAAMERAIDRFNEWNKVDADTNAERSAGKTATWSEMPRIGKTLIERELERLAFPILLCSDELSCTFIPAHFAESCAWNIATYAAIGDVCACFLKVEPLPAEIADLLVPARPGEPNCCRTEVQSLSHVSYCGACAACGHNGTHLHD